MRLQGWEWLIILAIVLLLFGAKRLPDAARGLGRSLRILKAETKGLHDDPESVTTTEPAALPQAPATSASPTSTPTDIRDAQPDATLPPAPDASRRPTA